MVCLAMRRTADRHPGESKADAGDAFIMAEAARSLPGTRLIRVMSSALIHAA